MSRVEVERVGAKGDGVAAGPIFVARALPGELVEGVVEQGRISSPRIVQPSVDRVKPPCRHYAACGGCAFQHATDDFVVGWKQDMVISALKSHGIEMDMRPVITSPASSRRRATLSARRTKKGALVGFHAKSSDTIVEIETCLLLCPELNAARSVVADLCRVGGSRRGELKVTLTRSEAGIDVSATGGKELDGPLEIALSGVAQSHDLARLSWEGDVVVVRRNPRQRFGTAFVTPPPGAFLQATPEGEAALVAAVDEAVGDAENIADLFAGCGTFSLPLAGRAQVCAVEGSAEMMAALDHGWRHGEKLKHVTTETRDLFRRPLMPDELGDFDAVVIDPPRAGAEAQVAELARTRVPRIAFVSCNPITFARDARVLIDAGWSLDWIQVVDQFRWSPHIELAAQFSNM